MIILGVHSKLHHTGACIVREKGESLEVVAISQERVDRVKDSSAYPGEAIEYCLNAFNLKSLDECDHIVFDYFYNPQWLNDRPQKDTIKAKLSFLKNRFSVKHKVPVNKVTFINHHVAHAYSAFYPSGLDEAAVLIVDGHGTAINPIKKGGQRYSGVYETQSLYEATRDGINLVETTCRPGLGMMYSAFTRFLGFKNYQEGKTMGLAPYGGKYSEKHIAFDPEHSGIVTDYSNITDFGAKEGKWILDNKLKPCTTKSDQVNRFYSRIAWEVQDELENGMLSLAKHAKELTGAKNLCIAGGVGLNCVANNRIVQEGLYENVWIQPASSDAGIPLGCALYGYYNLAKGRKKWTMKDAYLGNEYREEDIREALNSFSEYVHFDEDANYEKTAKLLADGAIVALLHGKSEYGPRALGHRSILVDPRKAENKDILNARVKFREAFRPFAPAVLEEFVDDYFEVKCPSPFMLCVAKAKEKGIKEIPAVIHEDDTGRLQTVNKADNGLFYDVIKAFYKLTGVPVLLNTSFNVAGEPIVETPMDAIKTFLKTNIDYLIMDRFMVSRKK